MPFDHQRRLGSPTGAEINFYTKLTAGQPRGVIQINHGLAEHAERYGRFADAMAAHGFHTFAHDHRGHGHTRAPDAPPRMFARESGVDKVLADIGAVHSLIATEHPGLPVILFGHSMGGLIGLNYVLRHPERIHAAAIWNANFSAGLPGRAAQAVLAWERFRLGSDVPSRILPKMTFGDWSKKIANRRTDFDWLSRDPAEVDKYIADPLCGWDASVSMWQDVFRFVFLGADDGNFAKVPKDLPFNLIGGERDPATSGGKAVTALEKRMKTMGFSRVNARVYPETRHESLNEVNRNAITEDFAAWASQVVPR
ncbi:MAG TPA: alpha/beta hydrolase [Rhizobiaceae bacterium]|nr:alpha/beta hydrolase [Rhizobiaceae bacterium]